MVGWLADVMEKALGLTFLFHFHHNSGKHYNSVMSDRWATETVFRSFCIWGSGFSSRESLIVIRPRIMELRDEGKGLAYKFIHRKNHPRPFIKYLDVLQCPIDWSNVRWINKPHFGKKQLENFFNAVPYGDQILKEFCRYNDTRSFSDLPDGYLPLLPFFPGDKAAIRGLGGGVQACIPIDLAEGLDPDIAARLVSHIEKSREFVNGPQ